MATKLKSTKSACSKALNKATRLCKGPSALARACGVTPQAVNKWLDGQVPAARCIAVELATQGKVTRYELRPDVFGTKPILTPGVKGSSPDSAGV